jgi:hypothetical protein
MKESERVPGAAVATEEGPAPWERQEGEPKDAFNAFCTFRDMGQSRGIFKAFKQKTGKKTAKTANGTWTKWSSDWNWTSRALAWDDELDRINREEQIEARKRMAKLHARAGEQAIRKSMAKMRKTKTDDIPIGVVPRLLDSGVKTQRLALGEPDTIQDQRQSGKVGVEVDVFAAAEKMANDLRAKRAGLPVTPQSPERNGTAHP